MTVTTDTLAQVDQCWRTARDIYRRVGCWGFTSVRFALYSAAERREIESRKLDHPNGCVSQFRLVQAEASSSAMAV